MHTVDLIVSALSDAQKIPTPVTPEWGICCVTGEETMTIPRKKLFGNSFMDANKLAAPDSDRVGVNAWWAMQYGAAGRNEDGTIKKRRKKPEMQACWWATIGDFRVIGKPEIRQMVLTGSPSTPWAGWVTTSYKKHGALRAPVNAASFGIWAFDDLIVDASDRNRVLSWWRRLRQAQDAGIGRTAIETGELSPKLIIRVGVDIWQAFDRWARTRRQAPLYKLLAYLLPSQKELKDGYSDEQYL